MIVQRIGCEVWRDYASYLGGRLAGSTVDSRQDGDCTFVYVDSGIGLGGRILEAISCCDRLEFSHFSIVVVEFIRDV